MAYELDIHYEGTAPGVAEHRLSLGAFGPALNQLVFALRRIATQLVKNAVEGEHPKTGRFADPARNLDIEIVKIDGNSLGLATRVAFHDLPQAQPNLPLWADLPERAGSELLDALDRESKGQLSNSAVRKYFAELPDGISRQSYNFHLNGRSIRRVDIGQVQLTTLPVGLAYLRKAEGDIVGVGFDPGRNEVRVKPESGNLAVLGSASEQVDGALEMRHSKVRTLSVQTVKGVRLISLRRASDPAFKFDPETATRQIFTRWDKVLKKLAK
ncbi:MAG: hypothetical protein ABSG72_08495 [Candidatus Sulfotelmatobacter sp.]|jgi:hypothetical protein